MRPLNRVQPALPAEHMRTFQIKAPVSTHFKKVACEKFDGPCKNRELGWKMQIDLGTDLGQQQARYIKFNSGRTYEVVDRVGTVVTLIFPPGQACFGEHLMRLDRPEAFISRDGDFRGNPRGTKPRVHTKPEHWVEELHEHTDAVEEARKKG